MPVLTLGDLETEVMEFFWRSSGSSCDVKAVQDAVGAPRKITQNTIQSTIKRLYEKGLLARRKVSHAFLYSAKVGRADFQRLLLERVAGHDNAVSNDALLSAIVDWAARSGRDQLERLEALVNARLADANTPEDD